MADKQRAQAIVDHITANGPKTQRELARELSIPETSVSYYLMKPLQKGLLKCDKVQSDGGKREVLQYRLPSKPDFSNVNPNDPFGLVAKKAAGVDIDLPHAEPGQIAQDVSSEVEKMDTQTTILDNDEPRPPVKFACALWSNGLLEIRRGEWTLATLMPEEIAHVREFLGRVAA